MNKKVVHYENDKTINKVEHRFKNIDNLEEVLRDIIIGELKAQKKLD